MSKIVLIFAILGPSIPFSNKNSFRISAHVPIFLARFLFFALFIVNYEIGQNVVFASHVVDILNIIGLMLGLTAYCLVVATWCALITPSKH